MRTIKKNHKRKIVKPAKPKPRLLNEYEVDWRSETIRLLKQIYPQSWQQKLWNLELAAIAAINAKKVSKIKRSGYR